MKTKCMSCGGPTKKMQNGGTADLSQDFSVTKIISKIIQFRRFYR